MELIMRCTFFQIVHEQNLSVLFSHKYAKFQAKLSIRKLQNNTK